MNFSQQHGLLFQQAQIRLGQALADMRRNIRPRQIGAKVKNTPFLISYPPFTGNPALDTYFGKPKLLIPANKNRMGFIIAQWIYRSANFQEFRTTYFSFGYPQAYDGDVPNGMTKWGIFTPGIQENNIAAFVREPLGNGTISTDAIWVTIDKLPVNAPPGTPVFPSAGFVIAYESALAVESPANIGAAA